MSNVYLQLAEQLKSIRQSIDVIEAHENCHVRLLPTSDNLYQSQTLFAARIFVDSAYSYLKDLAESPAQKASEEQQRRNVVAWETACDDVLVHWDDSLSNFMNNPIISNM